MWNLAVNKITSEKLQIITFHVSIPVKLTNKLTVFEIQQKNQFMLTKQ